MPLATETIVCDITKASGLEIAEGEAKLEFKISDVAFDEAVNEIIPRIPIVRELDEDGKVSVDLWPNDRGSTATFYEVILVMPLQSPPGRAVIGSIYVEENEGPHDLVNLLLAGVTPAAPGILNFNARIGARNGTAAAPGYTFADNTNTGLYRPGDNQIGASTGGVERWVLGNSGFEINVPVTGTAVQSSATDATSGKLLKVGAFGLGGDSVDYSGDVDDPTIPTGRYYAQSGATGTKPDGQNNGFLDVWRRAGNVSQTWVGHAGPTFTRYYRSNETWTDWTRVYSENNIVDTVTQSGGVPTGAIIERGSNVNGEFVKYADGTLICKNNNVSFSITGVSNFTTPTIDYPSSFASEPTVSSQAHGGTPRWDNNPDRDSIVLRRDSGVTGTRFQVFSQRDFEGDFGALEYIAIGRWF